MNLRFVIADRQKALRMAMSAQSYLLATRILLCLILSILLGLSMVRVLALDFAQDLDFNASTPKTIVAIRDPAPSTALAICAHSDNFFIVVDF